MVTVEPQTLPVSSGMPPASVQPGGGFCMGLELAWGRWRRWWLRRFRAGHVRRMAEKRQGHCDNCPHDIVDARDLKFYRNVCGYWFRPEDDPFRWRERLGLARAGLCEIVCFSLLFLAVALLIMAAGLWLSPWCWTALVVVLPLWFEVVSFFRDPERAIPPDPDALLSPADGTVTHVGEVPDPDFPGGRAFRVSIFLSVFNVHVNRIPRSGRVVNLRYFPGAFLDARHPECGVRNEQLWIDMEEAGTGRPLRIKQISGKIARRIVCWLKTGEELKAGDRLGMIKFGSRTEVYLSAAEAIEVLAKVGDTVKGGETILLRFVTDPVSAGTARR
jgi:phosphatidylserine decarboxylase